MTSLANEKPHTQETLLSLIIMVILAVVAATVLHVQQRFNPAVKVKHQVGSLSASETASSSSEKTTAIFPVPSGLKPLSRAEVFGSGNLSDKINGKAELYLSSGFMELRSQRFQDLQDAGFWLEVFLYDMETPENAFAVFSAQRREDGEPMDITPHAYRSANALFFTHGPYYVEIIAATTTASENDPLRQVAVGFIKAHPVRTAAVSEQDLFPAEGLDRVSIVRLTADVFGFARLDDVYAAEYRINDEVATLFLSRRPSGDAARALASDFHRFLLEFGGIDEKWENGVEGALAAELMGLHEMVFTIGPFLAGVHEADSRELARKLALRLSTKLREAVGHVP